MVSLWYDRGMNARATQIHCPAGCRIAIVYFSATEVTHTYARVMQQTLLDQGCAAQLFTVTAYTSRQDPLPVVAFDAFVFGVPVFADFAPSVINDWLPTLDGQGKRCTQFFTYGARTSGYAHFHTRLLLEQAGFRVLFSAEFLGRHSFNVGGWQMVPDRPNEQDLALAREYAALAAERFSQEAPPAFHLQKPFGYHRAAAALKRQRKKQVERDLTHPTRMTDTCSMCRECETECPVQAFDADTGLSDPATCIECMRCVYICPDGVIQLDERMRDYYPEFLRFWHLTEEMMNVKESKILTESWQAAS